MTDLRQQPSMRRTVADGQLQDLHLILHELEQLKVAVRTQIRKMQCEHVFTDECRYPICQCGQKP